MSNVVKRRESLAKGPLWAHFAWAIKREFRGFDWRKISKELFWGAVVVAVSVAANFYFDLSSKGDWDEHPVVLVSLSLFGLLAVLFWDISTRTCKAAIGIYRARQSTDFREPVHAVLAIIIGAVVYASILAYPIYLNYPHLHLRLGVDRWKVGEMDLSGLTQRSGTFIYFPKLSMVNSGAETYVPESSWSIDVRTIAGVVFHGGSNYIKPQGSFVLNDNLVKEMLHPIKRGSEPVSGKALFVLVGVSPSVINTPGTKLTINFSDAQGSRYSFSVTQKEM